MQRNWGIKRTEVNSFKELRFYSRGVSVLFEHTARLRQNKREFVAERSGAFRPTTAPIRIGVALVT